MWAPWTPLTTRCSSWVLLQTVRHSTSNSLRPRTATVGGRVFCQFTPPLIHGIRMQGLGQVHDVRVVVHILPTGVAGLAQVVDQLPLFLVKVTQPWVFTGLEAIAFMGVRKGDDV